MKATQSIIDQRKRREARVFGKNTNRIKPDLIDPNARKSGGYTKYNQDLANEFESWGRDSVEAFTPHKPLHFKISPELMRGVYKTNDDEKIQSIRKSGAEYFANQDIPIDPEIGEKIWNRSLSVEGLSLNDIKIDANIDAKRLATWDKYCKSHDESISGIQKTIRDIDEYSASLVHGSTAKKPSIWSRTVNFFKR